MLDLAACPRCHMPIPADAPLGTCPACLLRLGMVDASDRTTQGSDADPAVAPTLSLPGRSHAPGATRTGPGYDVSPEDGVLPWLADYEVLEEIGRGGGGIVFRARQWGADRIVALKFLLRGTGSPVERQRFRTEVRALGRLNHPNVVIVYDVGEADGCPYFAMEYLPGGSLGKRAREQPYVPADAAALVETLAHAVHAGHDAGVLHRDLKPGNVLLTADGVPKIADFGLAKRWDGGPDADTIDRMTRSREVIGTPAYMAPEQAAANHGSVGPATDVYGLGTILYELLTGGPPFKGGELQDTRWHVLNTPVTPPRNRNRKIPPALEAIALKSLEKNPALRYPTARELAEDLGRFRRGDETIARPLSLAARVGRTARRHSRALGLVAAGVCLLTGAVAVGSLLEKPDGEIGQNRDDGSVGDPDAAIRQMEAALRDGKSITPIGPTGRPGWHRWSGSDAVFTTSSFHDETCCVLAAGFTRMVLIENVPESGYRLRCEMRHETTLDLGIGSEIGLFFGLKSVPAPAGGVYECWYTLAFNDFAPEPNNLQLPDNYVQLVARARLVRPGWARDSASNVLGTRPFTPGSRSGRPGWHTVEIDVRPTGITARWGADEKGLALVGQRPPSAATIDSVWPGLFEKVRENARDAQAPAWPGWSPGGSAGLFIGRGQASFRNFVIEP